MKKAATILTLFSLASVTLSKEGHGSKRPLKVLLFCPGFSRSHLSFSYRLASTLHNRGGHEVTVITNFIFDEKLAAGDLKPPPGIEDIRRGPPENATKNVDFQKIMEQSAFSKESNFKVMIDMIMGFHTVGQTFALACDEMLSDQGLIEKLRQKKIDLVVSHYFSMCPLAMAALLNVDNVVWDSPGTYIMDIIAKPLRIPTAPSYIPHAMTSYGEEMTFWQRTANAVIQNVFLAISCLPIGQQAEEKRIFKKRLGELRLESDVSQLIKDKVIVLLVNGDGVLDYPRPLIPGLLHTGDLEHKKANKLDEQWQQLMDNAGQGVILFSLGTVANTSGMPMDMKDAFFKAFKRFPNHTIIWRLEGDLPERISEQKHIRIVHWLPQRELLAHPNLKLFIAHGGYNSLLETAQAGVPMLLMPLFGDQPGNTQRAKHYGLGLALQKTEVTEEVLVQKMTILLAEDRYKKHCEHFASIMRDKHLPNEDAFLHQIEKHVRHGKPELLTMKASRNLNFFQLYLLDVLAIFVSAVAIFTYVLLKIVKLYILK